MESKNKVHLCIWSQYYLRTYFLITFPHICQKKKRKLDQRSLKLYLIGILNISDKQQHDQHANRLITVLKQNSPCGNHYLECPQKTNFRIHKAEPGQPMSLLDHKELEGLACLSASFLQASTSFFSLFYTCRRIWVNYSRRGRKIGNMTIKIFLRSLYSIPQPTN